MFIPKKFQQIDPHALNDIILQYSFATLITHSDIGLEANHIPFYLTHSGGKTLLQGHIAKTNPLWKNVKNKADVLVVFNGPNCYISPNYYPTKQETNKAVPTWNYVTVHVKGIMSYIHDKEWNLNMINNLTDQHEAKQTIPWSVSEAPDEYIKKMLSAIVGIEIDVSSITGQWKVSQNQSTRNKQGVISSLLQENEPDAQKIADLIKSMP